ncbi:MAG: T9SS type A sorting domain-containing protein [Bacteroidales bacterium]|nr:T9SS type A sorting domain-containing protein [Bacteroidales bacterium]
MYFVYDEFNQLAFSIEYNWNSTSLDWVKYGKTDLSYNEEGNVTQQTIFSWDNDDSIWLEKSKTNFLFDAADILKQKIYSTWDTTTTKWLKTREFWCDEKGRDTLEVHLQNDIITYKYIFRYENDLCTRKETHSWYNDSFILEYLHTYQYNNKKELLLSESYNIISDTLRCILREEQLFDEMGNKIHYAYYYNSQYDSFECTEKDSMYFDDNGNLMYREVIRSSYPAYNVSYVYNYKTIYNYDNNFNLVQIQEFSRRRGASTWNLVRETQTFYDIDGKDSLEIINHDCNANTCSSTSETVYSYDYQLENQNLLASKLETHISNGNVIDKERTCYDENEHDTLYERYLWDNVLSIWNKNNYTRKTYNLQGNLSQIDEYEWSEESEVWKKIRFTEKTYNIEGKLVQSVENYWNEETLQWHTIRELENVYSATNQLLEVHNYWWNVNSDWGTLYSTFYNENGTDTIFINSLWDSIGNTWVRMEIREFINSTNSYKAIGYNLADSSRIEENFSYEYNSNNDLIRCNLYNLKIDKNNYRTDIYRGVSRKMEFSYPYTVSEDKLIIPDVSIMDGKIYDIPLSAGTPKDSHDRFSSYLKYYYENDEWTVYSERIMYYSQLETEKPTAIEMLPSTQTKGDKSTFVYPNPVKETLHIIVPDSVQTYTVRLLTLNGTCVLVKENEDEISVDSFESGMYLLQILDNKHTIFTTEVFIE